MTPAKLNVHFAFFPYGGNGSTSAEHPSIRAWFAGVIMAAKADERIGEIIRSRDYADTPITMTRNKAVRDAIKGGADVLVMCDSDQHPDLYSSDGAKPFFPASFDFIYSQRMAGKPSVVGSPYCGPPPTSNVYVFRWANWNDHETDVNMRLEQYSREEAAGRAGIEEVAALPTGLIMYDLKVFEALKPPYFYYEYTDEHQTEKASTEDVTNTRDIALIHQERYGYNPIHCNWDSWAGHYKPWCVGKPKVLTTEAVNDKYRAAIEKGVSGRERLTHVRNGHFHVMQGSGS